VEAAAGAEHFSGKLEGSVENGRLTVDMHDAKMPYETVFRAPLEIEQGSAVLNWLRNDKGFQLDGRHIDVKAKAVHARGDFRYLQPQGMSRGWAFWPGSAPMMALRPGATSRKT
jgi:uncharacterized protein YhdP